MENADQRGTGGFRLADQFQHHLAIGVVEGRRRFVEQHQRPIHHEATGDVDPLLFAAGEGPRRQLPEPPRDIQAAQQRLGAGLGDAALPATGQGRLHDHVQAGDPGDHPQELADITQGALAHVQQFPRFGADQFQPVAGMAHADAAAGRQVVAIQGAQQGTFAGAGLAVEYQALAGIDAEGQAVQHIEHHTVLLVQGEGFREVADLEQRCHRRHLRRNANQGCRTEDTSSCE